MSLLSPVLSGWRDNANEKISYSSILYGVLSFYFQMKLTQLLPLDAAKRAVRMLLLCRPILDHVNREFATRIRKHSKALNRFASRPKAEFTQAVPRRISPRDPGCELRKPHVIMMAGSRDISIR
jgi:hypothetical protein